MSEKSVDLSDAEISALVSSRLMVSGHYRMPWTVDGAVWRSLQSKGLVREGSYLTEQGEVLRARASKEQSK